MAIYYVDYVNGNDANNGTSWAQAWKSLTTGATAARTAPGDEIRVAKTTDPDTLAGGANWGLQQGAHWLSTPTGAPYTQTGGSIISVVPDTTSWTSGSFTAIRTAGVYRGTDTTNGGKQCTCNAATSKAIYVATTVDLSTCDTLTFWIYFNANIDNRTAANFAITLCSDATADTPIASNTFNIPKGYYPASTWHPISVTNGASLPSNVASMRLEVLGAQSSVVVVLDHFVAISRADVPSYDDVIGFVDPNDSNDVWAWLSHFKYQWDSGSSKWRLWIGGAGITPSTATSAVPTAYTGSYVLNHWATRTDLTMKRRKCFNLADLGTAWMANTQQLTLENFNEAGSQSARKRIIGGWNTSNTTRDGETWVKGARNNWGVAYGDGQTGLGYVDIEYFGTLGFNRGFELWGSWMKNQHLNCSAVHCGYAVFDNSTAVSTAMANDLDQVQRTFHSMTQCISAAMGSGGTQWTPDAYGRTPSAANEFTHYTYVKTIICGNGNSLMIWPASRVRIDYLDSNITVSLFGGMFEFRQIVTGTSASTSAYSSTSYAGLLRQVNKTDGGFMTAPGQTGPWNMPMSSGILAGQVFVENVKFERLTDHSLSNVVHTPLRMKNCQVTNATEFGTAASTTQTAVCAPWQSVTFQNFDDTDGYHKVVWPGYDVQFMDTVSTPTHSGTVAWRCFGKFNSTIDYAKHELAKAYVVSGKLVTVKIWTRKSNASADIIGYLSVPLTYNSAIVNASTVTNCTPSATDTWEEKTMTFTPDRTGWMTLIWNFGGSGTAGHYIYFDDLTITQAD